MNMFARQVSEMNFHFERDAKVDDFGDVALALLRGRGVISNAQMEAASATKRVKTILQKASPGSLAGSWADGILDEFGIVAAGFVESLANVGLFDRVAASAKRIPAARSVTVVVGAASGSAVAEGGIKPLTDLGLANVRLLPQKSVAHVIVSDELLRVGGPATRDLINTELRTAVARATDATFVAAVLGASGSPPPTSSGNVLADFDSLLAALSLGSTSQVVIGVSPDIIKQLITMTAGGALLFPSLTINGGVFGGMAIVVVDAADAGTIVAVDATQFAVDAGSVALSTGDSASVQWTEGGALQNVWQRNEVALRAERWFAFKQLRDGAAAALTGADYNSSP